MTLRYEQFCAGENCEHQQSGVMSPTSFPGLPDGLCVTANGVGVPVHPYGPIQVRSFDDGGSIWTIGVAFEMHGCALSNDGHVFATGPDGTFKLRVPDLVIVWHNEEVTGNDIAVLADGQSTIVVREAPGGGDLTTIVKLDEDGEIVWTFNPNDEGQGSATLRGVVALADGSCVVCGGAVIDSTNRNVVKINAAGDAVVWHRDLGHSAANAIAVDSTGELYVAGARNDAWGGGSTVYATVWKLNSSGVVQWGYDTLAAADDGSNEAGDVAVSPNDSLVYVCGDRDNVDEESFWALTSGGSLSWSIDTGYMTKAVEVAENNEPILVAPTENAGDADAALLRRTTGGSSVWSYDGNLNVRSNPVDRMTKVATRFIDPP